MYLIVAKFILHIFIEDYAIAVSMSGQKDKKINPDKKIDVRFFKGSN